MFCQHEAEIVLESWFWIQLCRECASILRECQCFFIECRRKASWQKLHGPHCSLDQFSPSRSCASWHAYPGQKCGHPCFNGHDNVGASRISGMMDTVLNLGLNDEIVQVSEDFSFFFYVLCFACVILAALVLFDVPLCDCVRAETAAAEAPAASSPCISKRQLFIRYIPHLPFNGRWGRTVWLCTWGVGYRCRVQYSFGFVRAPSRLVM